MSKKRYYQRSRRPNESNEVVQTNLFTNYLSYTAETEAPIIYHRWCYLTTLGAVIGRKAHLPHGHFRVFPNLYVMLLGEPAARKSTSIKIAKKLLSSSGYDTFAADKTSKEKFLLDLEGITTDDTPLDGNGSSNGSSSHGRKAYDATTAENIWGNNTSGEPREVFVVADEFKEFAGSGNLEFYTTLGNFWDFDSPTSPFTQRLKNSRSVSIYQPTISILAGNTPELFARAFPPEAIGSGFLSRLLLIHGERSGRRITFPPPPDKELEEGLANFLRKLQKYEVGELHMSAEAKEILHEIYQQEDDNFDVRFKGYYNRRFTQLLKICVILTVSQFAMSVNENTVVFANTILSC